MNNDQIEQEIQAKGLNAPRVTPADVEANILNEYYFTARDGVENLTPGGTFHASLGLLTFCVLVLKNGFTVHGYSACASPENFDAKIGRDIARKNAVDEIWPLMGYELRSQLSAKHIQAPELTMQDVQNARNFFDPSAISVISC